jgi:hypothetical protein
VVLVGRLLQVYWVLEQLKRHQVLLVLPGCKAGSALNWLAKGYCLRLLQCLVVRLLLQVRLLLKA